MSCAYDLETFQKGLLEYTLRGWEVLSELELECTLVN